MDKEIVVETINKTRDSVLLPLRKKAICHKWVCKVKLKPNGSFERCKARIVTKGYNQQYGVHYEKTFFPVVKMNIVRGLIALSGN